jgi:hypothetical protein
MGCHQIHQADGTIIRNNDILIETNRLRGTKTLVKAWDDQSDFSIMDDRKENR